MTISADQLCSRFDGVIDRGDGSFYARCPAHDDKSPFLSVRDTGETWLIHCFAGCSAEDVLAAVGLTFGDLCDDESRAARQTATATAARDYHKRTRVDLLDHERLILEIAQSDIAAGKQLSVEDRARVQLALLRMKETA